MTSRGPHENDCLGAIPSDDKAISRRETCPHMLRPDRCGVCLHDRHVKRIYEEMTESEKRLLKGGVRGTGSLD
jgi:hypothetical protein